MGTTAPQAQRTTRPQAIRVALFLETTATLHSIRGEKTIYSQYSLLFQGHMKALL